MIKIINVYGVIIIFPSTKYFTLIDFIISKNTIRGRGFSSVTRARARLWVRSLVQKTKRHELDIIILVLYIRKMQYGEGKKSA